MPCIRESAFVVDITPGSVVFPTYNAKAVRARRPQAAVSERAQRAAEARRVDRLDAAAVGGDDQDDSGQG